MLNDTRDIIAAKQLFAEEVSEFIEVCEYNNRTLEENLAILIEDNPEPDDVKYFTEIFEAAKARKA